MANPVTYEFTIPVHLIKYIDPLFDFRGPNSAREDLAQLIVIFHPSLQDLVFPLFARDTKEKLAMTYEVWVVPFLKAMHVFEPTNCRLIIYNFKFDYDKAAVSSCCISPMHCVQR